MRVPSLVGCAALFVGCATVTVDGYDLDAQSWTQAERHITTRAAAELPCEATEIEMRVVAVSPQSAETVAVTGCGKAAIYKRVPGVGWVMDFAGVQASRDTIVTD